MSGTFGCVYKFNVEAKLGLITSFVELELRIGGNLLFFRGISCPFEASSSIIGKLNMLLVLIVLLFS